MRFRISPVIGVMIMVALTVLLAAGVAYVVFGMSGSVEKTREITGVVMVKTVTGSGGTINMVDEENRGTVSLMVKDNALFNSIQTLKRYRVSATAGGEVKSVEGPL
jgi:FlaG/FlaF family flagellin (archaellin)